MKTDKTVHEILHETASRLRSVSGEDAEFEAKELVIDGLRMLSGIGGMGREKITTLKNERFAVSGDLTFVFMPYNQEDRLEELMERRLSHEPLQYILGEWEFMGLPFKVSPAALIPRQDTETLCEEAERLIHEKQYKTLLDICTGTGCIGISLAVRCGVKVTLADISPECLELAGENAKLNNISREIKLIKSDLFANIKGRFDIITVNPPYIPTDVLQKLSPEVQREPALALDGGADGLDFYRRIKGSFQPYLNENGTLILEIGFDQGKSVCEIFSGCGKISLKQDLSGNDRVVIVET